MAVFSLRWHRGRSHLRSLGWGALIGLLSPLATVDGAPPKLTGLFPPGAARGQKVVVTASGEFGNWPVQWWSDRTGLRAVSAADKGKVEIEVTPEATPGVYWLRAVQADGASSLRPFVVGNIGEVEEVEPNDLLEKGQELTLPVTVNARIGKAGDVDGFVVKLQAGERLFAALDANLPLGSPMDAVLQVAEISEPPAAIGVAAAKFPRRPTAYVVEQCDDETGLDPRLTFVAPRAGRYLVRAFAFPSEPNANVSLAGGDNFVYRLTLTSGPYVDYVLPLARSLAAPAEPLAVHDGSGGPARPLPAAELPPPRPEDEGFPASDRRLEWLSQAGAAGAFPGSWTSFPSLVAAPEALTPAGQAITAPVTLSGQLPAPGQRATFQITAPAGQKLRLKVDARGLGFSLDPFLAVVDDTGKVVAENDDSNNQRDATLAYTVPAMGKFTVQVRDVHGQGGARYAYRLTIEPIEPDFALSVATDSFVLSPGKPLEIPVTIERRDGLDDVIELQMQGLPAGVTQAPARSEAKGDSAKSVKLVLQADAGQLPEGANVSLQLIGTTAGATPRRHRATFAVPGSPVPHHALWLTVTKP